MLSRSFWHRLPLRSKALAVLLPLLLSLLAAGAGLAIAQASVERANEAVLRTTQVQREVAESLRLLIDAETGVRGYLLDGREVFLEPYEAARPVVLPSLERIEPVLLDDEAEALLQQAIGLAEAELAQLQAQVETGPDLPIAQLQDTLLISKQRMDALRQVIGAFDDREAALLEERLDDLNRSQFRQTAALVLTLVLGLSLGVGGLLLLAGEVSGRLRALTLARGSAVDGIGDEVDQLGAAIEAAEAQSRASAAEAEAARRLAEQASSAKTEFLARMSHELRTPLNAVLGFTQLLERSRLDDEQRESVQQVLRAGQHLLALINDVLDLSQVESGDTRLIMEAVEVSSAVRSAADLVRPLADQVGARLVVSGPDDVHLLADRRRLSQVLINLLGNALKYGGSTPDVVIRWTDPVGGHVRLTVADRGPGIPTELVSRLFVPFDRLGAEATSTEGSGVGLPLSKQLVEAMGGELRVDSEVGEGTAFTLALAAAECAASTPAEPVAAQQGEATARSTTVICVEDNPVNLALVRQALRGRPHLTLLTSLRGDQGLDLIRERLPDLVLLDSNLPGLSGQEVLTELKQDPRTADIPVVVLSADARPEGIAQMMQAGARQYLTKPVDLRELLEVVDSLTVSLEE